MKFKRIRFKKPALLRKARVKRSFGATIKSLSRIVVMSVITAVIISVIYLAIPKTEVYISPFTKYDLRLNNQQWKAEYKVGTSEKDETKLQGLRNIIASRLQKYGVEEFVISQPVAYGEDRVITISAQSVKPQNDVQQLIENSGDLVILEPKEGVDLEKVIDESTGATAGTDINNFNRTEYDRKYFRNIDIKLLPYTDSTTNEQTEAYYGIFKAWAPENNKFKDYLAKMQGKTIGVKINEQILTKVVDSNDLQLFALGFGQTEDQAHFYDVLLNSGVIEFDYSLASSTDLTATYYSYDFMISFGVFVLGVVLAAIFIFIKKREVSKTIQFVLAVGIVLAVYVGYYKLSLEYANLYFMNLAGLIVLTLNLMSVFKIGNIKNIAFGMTVLFVVVWLFSLGTNSILARDLALVTVAVVPTDYLMKKYLVNLNRALLR